MQTPTKKCESMSKKANAAYWDEIDSLAEDFVNNMVAYGFDENNQPVRADAIDDDEKIELYKEVVQFVIDRLSEMNANIDFPFVDENL